MTGWSTLLEERTFSISPYGEEIEIAKLYRDGNLDWVVDSELCFWKEEYVEDKGTPLEEAKEAVEQRVEEHLEDMRNYYSSLLSSFKDALASERNSRCEEEQEQER